MPSNKLNYSYFHKDQNNIEVTDEDLTSSNLYLHWMVINVPGAKVDQGQTVTSYKGPAPKPGSGVHRYVILAYEQKSDTPMRIDHSRATFRTSFPCQVSINNMFSTMPIDIILTIMVNISINFYFCCVIGKWPLKFRFIQFPLEVQCD